MTLPFPKAVLAQHVVVLGKTRSGKSSTLRLIAEELLDDKRPLGIVDPKGDWWGIKSSADGKRAGYELVIFGGDHADVPINAHSGKAVAELVATGNRPYLIDLGGWMVGERTRFFIDFASTLFTHTHGHRWLIVDECHNFAPQGKVQDPQAGMSLHWANRLASEGAGKGIVLLSASQRPQKVHKDYLTSHETLIAKRVIHKLDRDADKDWIDACGDPEKGREVLATLAGLQRSQGWVYSPEIDFGPKIIDFPMFETYDSFKPQTGKVGRRLKGWASVDLDEVKEKLAVVVEEAKANDPKELKAQLAEKTRQIAQLTADLAKKPTAPPDKGNLKKIEARAIEQAKKHFAPLRAALEVAMNFIVSINAKDFFKAGGEAVDKKAIEKAISDATGHVTKLVERHLQGQEKQLDGLRLEAQRLAARIKTIIEKAGEDVNIQVDVRHNEPHTIAASAPAQPSRPVAKTASGDGSFTGPQTKILRALAFWSEIGDPEPTREMVAAVAGYRFGSGNFNNLAASLGPKSASAVSVPRQGRLSLIVAGIEPFSKEEARDNMLSIFDNPERKIIAALNGAGITTREDAATRSGYQYGSGNFNNLSASVNGTGVSTVPEKGSLALSGWAQSLL
jgi:uncharacterized protein